MLQVVRTPECQNEQSFETAERRYAVLLRATILFGRDQSHADARICNISEGGFLAVIDGYLNPSGHVLVTISGLGEFHGWVAWARRPKVGIQLDEKIDPPSLLAERSLRAIQTEETEAVIGNYSFGMVSPSAEFEAQKHNFST